MIFTIQQFVKNRRFNTPTGIVKLIFICGLITLPNAKIWAQIDITTGYSALELAEILVGDGIEITDASLTCDNVASGAFQCIDCNLGIDSGLVLTTGKATNAQGPNNNIAISFDNGEPGDSDLDALPGLGTDNACVLEIDFIPNNDTVSFDYVFGSDEYNEWVGTSFNDLFAFWISGPGITGAVNIALVPGTSTAVRISSINLTSYSTYYNNNPSAGLALTDPYYIEYEGFTTVLQAAHEVTACENYHLKLAIADVGDGTIDSGVFLKVNSLTTDYIAAFTYPSTGFGIGTSYCTTDVDPTPDLEDGATVGIFSATPVGLALDPTTGTIDLSASTPGFYTVLNTVVFGTCTLDTIADSSAVTITAPYDAVFSYAGSPFCSSDVAPSPIVEAGSALGTFTASPSGLSINAITGVIDLSASAAGTFTITNSVAAPGGCPTAIATTTIVVEEAAIATFSYSGSPFCSDETDALVTLSGGASAGLFSATPSGISLNASTGTINLGASAAGSYTVTNTISASTACPEVSSFVVVDIDDPLDAGFTYSGSPWCANEPDPSATLNLGSTAGIFTASPTGLSINAITGTIDLSASTIGTYTITNSVDAVGGCSASSSASTITILPTFTTTQIVAICNGSTFILPDGTSVASTGTYTISLLSEAGCDSINTTVLTVNPVYSIAISASICADGNYTLPDGSIVSTAGTYTSNLVTDLGCDSTIMTTLSVLPLSYSSEEIAICNGDFYTLPSGSLVSSAGTYTSTLLAANGCDSIITTTLEVLPIYTIPQSITICNGDFYTLPDGVVAGAAGLYSSNLLSILGCDSIITTTLTVLPASNITLSASICADESYLLPDGSTTTIAGTYLFTYPTVSGCDSIITVNMTVNPNPIITFIADTICVDDGIFALNAIPPGGIYSGVATSGSNFDPTIAGVGGPYLITYLFTDVNGCSDSATTEMQVGANFAEAYGDTTIIAGDGAFLSGATDGNYTWNPPANLACATCNETFAYPLFSTLYTLSSIDEDGCYAEATVFVAVEPNPGNTFFIPNSFTPNGDQINDYFFAYGPRLVSVKSMRIFDRWGALQFEKENMHGLNSTAGWDGTFKGKSVNSGVYVYAFELEFMDGEILIATGNISILK